MSGFWVRLAHFRGEAFFYTIEVFPKDSTAPIASSVLVWEDGLMGWLRHAFAVRPEGFEQLSPAEEALVERFCQAVVRRRLTPAALVLLETLRPLSGLASQGLYFFSPLLSLLVCPADIDQWAAFLQRPDALEILCQRLESQANEFQQGRNPSAEPPSSPLPSAGEVGRAEGEAG